MRRGPLFVINIYQNSFYRNAVAAKIPSVEDLLNLSDKLLFERQSISDTLTGIGHEAAHLSVPLERKRRKGKFTGKCSSYPSSNRIYTRR